MQSTLPSFKRACAIAILALFAAAAVLRIIALAINLPGGGLGISTQPIVHVIHLFILCLILPPLFALCRRSTIGRVVLSLVVAVLLAALALLDFSIVVASGPLQSIISLRMLATFYCGTSGYLGCALDYPAVLLGVVAALLTLTAIVLFLFDEIADCIVWLKDKLGAAFGRFLPVSHRAVAVTGIASYAVATISIMALSGVPIHAREPLYQLIVQPPPMIGPNGLFVGSPSDKRRVSPAPDLEPRTLVLIVVDSLRADSVRGVRNGQPLMPFVASQINQGNMRDLGPAIAICPASYCGMIGVQSSRSWEGLDAGPPLLISDVLAANGYTNVFFGSGRVSTTANLGEILNSNFAQFLDDSSADSSDRLDDREQIDRLRRFTPKDPQKTFLSIHLMSPHYAGLRFENPDPDSSESGRSIVLSPGNYREQYEAGVSQADKVIELIFTELARKGMLEDAMVIITADHGERIDPGVKPGHGEPLDMDVATIPMLVFSTRETDWPKSPLVSQMDAAPTLLKAVNIDPPPEFSGKPLQTRISRKKLVIHSGKDRRIVTAREGELGFLR